MLAKDTIQLKGWAEFVLTNQYGEVIDERLADNMIVTGGLGYITSRMKDATATAMGWMAVGTGATAVARTQTLLVAEVGRVSGTVTQQTTTYTNDTYQMVSSFGAGIGTGALVEAGIFNVVTANTVLMLNRLTFGTITKGASDTLAVTWKIQLS